MDEKTGIYNDIPHKDYLEIDRVSNSYLSKIAQVPACGKVKTLETPAMRIGTAFHTYVLEPEKFINQIAVSPKVDKRTKAGKAAYAEFTDKAEGKTVISVDEVETIQSMGETIQRHPRASLLLSNGIAESSIFWTDQETGIKCKARTDFLTNSGAVVDLKKTRNASPHGFLQSVVQYRYYQQAAFYLNGLNEIMDKGSIEYNRFAFIAVEDKPPFRVEVYELNAEFLEYGYSECQRLLDLEAECRETEFYPHYKDPGIAMLYKPVYLGGK